MPMDPLAVVAGNPDPTTKGEEVTFSTVVVDNISYVGDCWLIVGTTKPDFYTNICFNRSGSPEGCKLVITVHEPDDSHTDHTFYFTCRTDDGEKSGYIKKMGSGLGTKYYVGNYNAHTWEAV